MHIPHEILTDQRTNFMSRVMKALCSMLGITHLRTSMYLPQHNGLVERLDSKLKRMTQRSTQSKPCKWNTLLTVTICTLGCNSGVYAVLPFPVNVWTQPQRTHASPQRGMGEACRTQGQSRRLQTRVMRLPTEGTMFGQ